MITMKIIIQFPQVNHRITVKTHSRMVSCLPALQEMVDRTATLLTAALGPTLAERYPQVLQPQLLARIMGMFELNNLALVVPNPLYLYLEGLQDGAMQQVAAMLGALQHFSPLFLPPPFFPLPFFPSPFLPPPFFPSPFFPSPFFPLLAAQSQWQRLSLSAPPPFGGNVSSPNRMCMNTCVE